jgi:oxygen-independent coproporphyrinogen-3 oxidase
MIPSLYIHIPFCRKKCIYCDFYSLPYQEKMGDAYAETLAKQATALAGVFKTIYIGGGTPTILGKSAITKILTSLKGRFNDSTEFTIEANPESLSEDKTSLLLALGVNRISIGVQSLRDKKLSRLGRAHNSQAARQSVKLASKKGFKNISVDMIYGSWVEDDSQWREELEEATGLPATHISCYSLSYEKDTPLYDALSVGSVTPLEDETVAAMYEYTVDRLSVRGFKQYEISNFAKPGYESRHNLNYWVNGEYIGLGASAVSYINGSREANISDVDEYMRRSDDGVSLIASEEKLAPIKMARETAAVKIRTKDGIDFDWFKARTGFDFQELEKKAIKELVDKDLIKFKKDKGSVTGICLKQKGFLFCDTVSAAFL